MSAVASAGARADARAALRAELVKLRTVRSTTWALLTFVGVSILFSVWSTWESHTEGGSPAYPGDNDIVLDSLTGIWFGQIAIAVLGTLAITSEYSTRLIRSTLSANPRRVTVLTAKAAAVGSIALVAGLVACVVCFQLGQQILRGNGFTPENGYPTASLRDYETLQAVVGTGMYVGLLALFALGIGAILRHTAGAISVVLALVLGPVIAITFLPDSVAEYFEKFSLMGAGLAIEQTVDRDDNIPLEPWQGLAIVGAYATVAMIVALWLFRRHDA